MSKPISREPTEPTTLSRSPLGNSALESYKEEETSPALTLFSMSWPKPRTPNLQCLHSQHPLTSSNDINNIPSNRLHPNQRVITNGTPPVPIRGKISRSPSIPCYTDATPKAQRLGQDGNALQHTRRPTSRAVPFLLRQTVV
ncbi:polysaccharide lyase family 4 [Colletotrichum asianum]